MCLFCCFSDHRQLHVLTLSFPTRRSSALTLTVYNLSASYHFTEDMMSYINYGTSWRHPSNVVGIFRPLTPNLAQFTHLDPEKSKSIEAGLKADFLERRVRVAARSEEHTSELQSLMRISYAVFCLKKKKKKVYIRRTTRNE